MAAYGADKLNDPAQQEPLVQEMIKLNPNEPTNYFALAKIYEDNGDYEAAEQTFLKAKEVRPQEPTVYTQLAGFYNRQGDFDKTIAALQERAQREPNNPEAHHLIATYYWDKVYRDFRLPDTEKRKYIEAGIMSEDKAIELKGDYFEAITYKNLLLRLQANVEKDPGPAAGAAERSGPPPRPGAGAPQEAAGGRRRRVASHSPTALRIVSASRRTIKAVPHGDGLFCRLAASRPFSLPRRNCRLVP